MTRYAFVGRRILSLIPLLLGILLLLMLFLSLTPGDPARLLAGPRATDEAVATIARQLGLDQGLWHRYTDYVAQVLRGNLGTSFKSGRTVTGLIGEQLPVTLSLAASGVFVALIVSVPLAAAAARRPDGLADQLVRGLCVFGVGLPSFWVAVMAIRFIALPTGWFPVAGFGDGLAQHLRALTLPALVIGFSIAPPMIRSLRATLIELTEADYVLAGRTFGYGGLELLRSFQLRNAIPALVTLTATLAGYALFGTVVSEVAFGLPGMGQGLVTAASTRDFPLVQGYTLVFAVLIVCLYLVADIILSIVDPRTRISA